MAVSIAAHLQEDTNNSQAVRLAHSSIKGFVLGVPVHQMELGETNKSCR